MNYKELLLDWVNNMDTEAMKATCLQFGLIEEEAQLDWDAALKHLNTIRGYYLEIGAAGTFGLIFLNQNLARYEQGERTQDLYDSMMGAE